MCAVRVLLVDDSDSFIRAAARFLVDVCEVEVVGCAYSGEQAIKMVQELAPHFVLMDVEMGGMTGIEAAHIVKQQQPRPPQIVLISLDSERYQHMLSGDQLIDGFVSKSEFIYEIPRLLIAHSQKMETAGI